MADLWTWQGSMKRAEFIFWGGALFVIKYNLDRLLMWSVSGQRWSLLDYTKVSEYLWPKLPSLTGVGDFAALLLLGLPFMAAGVLLTLKRLRSAKLPPWLVLLFFVPVVKIIFFLLLCVLPSHERVEREQGGQGGLKGWLGLFIPRSGKGSAATGILFATAAAALGVWLGTTVLRSYGWTLFVGLPFTLGFLSVLVYGYHDFRSFKCCLGVSVLAVGAAGAALLLVAIEGVICIVMAAPLAVPMSMVGGCAAYQIQAADWWQGKPAQVFCVAIFAPLLMLAERVQRVSPPLFEVTSTLVVDAPPEQVWRNVVTFAELPPAHEFIFRAGVAYPIRARIYGTGVGAERHCEFSTGPFVEPIEVWDQPRLLKFSVTKNPPPMQEWTPYHDVQPAHLDGFLESRAGQFYLRALPGGRTRLEGTTWYHHHMWPATYWRWWSDYIIHTIHLRVLRHVKQLSEVAA